MFGMSDPNQTLSQMLRYLDMRYEMVEVMASEFTSMLLANKQRDGAMQTLLVKGTRVSLKFCQSETTQPLSKQLRFSCENGRNWKKFSVKLPHNSSKN